VNRTQKHEHVEGLKGDLQRAPHVVLAAFRGLSVNQATELRRRIRGVGGEYRVIKNRLARLAAAGTAAGRLAERFNGPCALALHADDPVALAKTLADFVKDNPQLELRAGVVDGRELIDEAGVKRLAALPGLPELRAQMLALVQTPSTMLVRLLQTPAQQMTRVLDARGEQLAPPASAS
jgi:large subunit ribosomal protein L10